MPGKMMFKIYKQKTCAAETSFSVQVHSGYSSFWNEIKKFKIF